MMCVDVEAGQSSKTELVANILSNQSFLSALRFDLEIPWNI